jgi:hypothetical protein
MPQETEVRRASGDSPEKSRSDALLSLERYSDSSSFRREGEKRNRLGGLRQQGKRPAKS